MCGDCDYGVCGDCNAIDLVTLVIASKASAEGACILAEIGYCYGVWLVTVIMVCVLTVML